MVTRIRSFTLKQRCFASGKMISPDRSQWVQCDCCGKWIVQGVELSNGHRIGNDCEEVRSRVRTGDNAALYKMFGTSVRVQDYMARVVIG